MKLYAILPMICLAVILGCDLTSVDPGGGATSPTDVSLRGAPPVPDVIEEVGPGVELDLSVPPGILVGRIEFDGAFSKLPPERLKSSIPANQAICAKNGDIPDESMLVDPETNGVANVFIYLDKRPKWLDKKPEWDPEVEQEGVDQQFCLFKPHALVTRVGTFKMKNSDTVSHNVKSGFPSVSFNPTLPPNESGTIEFKKPEKEPYPSSCAIHSWMAFYTLVLDHPYAAVTDSKGNFRIPNLPAGEHTFKVWHETGKLIERKLVVTIESGVETTPVVKKYPASKFKL